MNLAVGTTKKTKGYASVHGLEMYYEIEGNGAPLVFIPPAFGFAGLNRFPELVANHSVITQASHRRTREQQMTASAKGSSIAIFLAAH